MDPEASLQVETKPDTEGEDLPLPEGWTTAISPVDGRNYFFNESTGATSWKHPSLPGKTAFDTPPAYDINTIPSLGDDSGIMANRSTVVGDDEDIEGGYTKMSDYGPNNTIYSHRVYSVIALILFFPLGVIAVCRSMTVVSRYIQGQYEQAHAASKQTLAFARISCIIGVISWSYFAYCYFNGPGPYVLDFPPEWWPDFKYNEEA
mmetsp:Transcript_8527/g.17779  ORF Transcript_8527/g.17779 Transcript_8527/m.17779 type:complete len:205 (-) Transcript_8527:231-845(-)|eukprot:CAMPEP_0201124252 /NCGR_PEP_ID=MMETSP0850-20130426/10645_1 /ASSEMBLY_ACC=CAM_ASM_000622 /TAXON_ID=183588 /ORGANISM="Pseudo-nitzschia fraudulenta, Strain WWA7" /LENGTH=204 /DNA_ID=CAMNT_0047391463 /DNA_START=97 /DNA_END=711 /DNA_ORIENTATION=-